MDRALARISRRHAIATIIDVGASNGIWFVKARRFFPASNALLIEAQADPHEPDLQRLRDQDPRIDFVIAAAGNGEGSVHFDSTNAFGGAASAEAFEANDVVVQMTSIDIEVAQRGLSGPFLIKLDTHGFEKEILEGADQTLASTQALIIEAYNFELRPGVMRFHELCAFLGQRGFRCIDMADPMRRPADGVLWQMDLVFGRSDQAAFSSNAYT
jgi:FkbM family methyltransferase